MSERPLEVPLSKVRHTLAMPAACSTSLLDDVNCGATLVLFGFACHSNVIVPAGRVHLVVGRKVNGYPPPTPRWPSEIATCSWTHTVRCTALRGDWRQAEAVQTWMALEHVAPLRELNPRETHAHFGSIVTLRVDGTNHGREPVMKATRIRDGPSSAAATS